jgi:hypothetical protein
MFGTKLILITFLFPLLALSNLMAQGMYRSTGLGLRASVWKEQDSKSTAYSLSHVSSEGAGSLYFFSRIKNRWFFETSIGGLGKSEVGGGKVESINLTPFLFGARYDILSPRYTSQYQPYFTFGAGTYWISRSFVGEGRVETGSDAKFGVFVGGGLNIILKNWFALNSDIKYHLVNLEGTSVDHYSGFELSLGCVFMWGKKQEIFRIRGTKLIVKDIYPAYYQFYNTYPLALVTIENTAGYPIEVNLRSQVTPYSAYPAESGYIKIEKGEIKDVPIIAVFEPDIFEVSTREPAILDIEIEGRAGTTYTHEITAQLMVHTRNSWNGEIDKLVYFVTSEEKEIINLSRNIANRISNKNSMTVENLLLAEAVFNELSQMNIHYQSDPNVPFYRDDRVQFALETLKLKRGDCDDLVVLYASLLESLGIKTAFIQVKDPEKSIAHLYLMVDTGISKNEASKVSVNEKRYLIRKKSSGEYFVWIPVETTLLSRGFEAAWDAGALNFLEEAQIRNGLEEGWVRIFDVD